MAENNKIDWSHFAKASIALSVISLLADTIALAQLTFDIVTTKQPGNFVIQIIAVVLVFLFGLGIGSIAVQGGEKTTIKKVYGTFMWVYLVMACLTYLGIALQFREPYSIEEYIAYIIVIGLQITAFLVLRHSTQIQSMAYALAPLTIGLIHALLFLFQLVFVTTPSLQYVIGEWMFWAGWLTFGALLLRSHKSNDGGASDLLSSRFQR